MRTLRFLAVASAAALLCTGFCACSDDDDDDAPDNSTPEYSVTGTLNGHEYVDLGLSVKWATCNVGASTLEGCGDYFAWGETKTKSEYGLSNSVTEGKNMGNISGNATYDVARAKWGGTWRLPTVDEMEELINECKWTLTKQNGCEGYKVTGSNDNSIFLPVTGYFMGSTHYNEATGGYYWSGTTYGEEYKSGAYSLGWRNDAVPHTGADNRWYGKPVRPVSD